MAREFTRGPWSNDHQHGGPPAGLIAGAIARLAPDAGAFVVSRITLEILRPIPIGRCTVVAEMLRAGQRVQRVSASLSCDGVEVIRASAIRLRTATTDIHERALPMGEVPDVDSVAPLPLHFFKSDIGYQSAVEIRIARGEWGKGPLFAWMRTRMPLVFGEPTTPLEHAMILVDAESGICPPVDPTKWTFANPDLTVYFDRSPVAGWLGLDASSSAHTTGIGLAQAALVDCEGAFGRSIQSLALASR